MTNYILAEYRFNGWYLRREGAPETDEEPLTQAASYSFSMPSNDVSFTAKFVTAEEDKASIGATVDGMAFGAGSGGEGAAVTKLATNVWAGVYLEWPVAASALSETTVKVAGLPGGLKFTAKPVTSKVGSGKTAVTVTNVVATVTVAASGKITAKQPVNGKATSFAANYFDVCDGDSFWATLTAKVGSEIVMNVMAVTAAESGMGFIAAERFDAWQYNWKVEQWKTIGKSFDKREMSYEEDGVKETLKFSANGTAKVAGEFATYDADGNIAMKNGKPVVVKASGSALVTAKFLKKADDTVTIGAFRTAAEYETKREIAPIALSATGGSLPALSVSKLPSGLKFTSKAIADHAANTIYGTPTKSGIYSAQVSAKTAGGAKASAILPLVIRAKDERIVRVDCKTDMGKVSGGGIFADGKKASVKATPLSKRCFAGWKLDGKLVSRSASYSYLVDGRDVTLVADFVSKEQDLASVSLTFGGVGQSTEQIPTNVVRCGVFTSWPVAAKALTGTSVTASGLPSGLKLVKTLVDKELKEYSYEIVGVPTSVSKVNSKTKAVKPTVATVKVTSLGKSSASYRIAFIVEALPVWAYGTFNGFAAADEDGNGVGVAKMTVSASGKISGKFGLGGSNWTYSVSGYSCVESVKSQLSLFRFEGEAKYSSKVRRPFVAEVTQGLCNCSFGDIEGEGFAVQMRRSIWSDKPMPPSAVLPKTDLVSFGSVEGVKVSVSKSGKATFAGWLADGTKVTSSSVVFVGKDGHYCSPLIVPATKKYGGFLDIIDFSDDGND